MRALRLQYGDEQVAPILRLAGAVDWQPLTETEALDLLLHRDPALLPPRWRLAFACCALWTAEPPGEHHRAGPAGGSRLFDQSASPEHFHSQAEVQVRQEPKAMLKKVHRQAA
jgi:hypothetical protein